MSVKDAWGMVCPDCGADDGFAVWITCEAKLTENGTDVWEHHSDHHWDDDSNCNCTCGWEGKVGDCKHKHDWRLIYKDGPGCQMTSSHFQCVDCGETRPKTPDRKPPSAS